MQTSLKLGLGVTALLLAVAGGEVALIHHRNNEEMPMPKNPYPEAKLSPDDSVFIRKQYPDSLKDERALIGKTVWVSAAAQLDYYPYANHHADYTHPVTTLPGAAPLVIRDVFEQVPPSTGHATLRIPGPKHVLLAFNMPQSPDPKALYAIPVATNDAGSYTFYTDSILFYDDPHILYKHWGPEMWAHIDKHEPALGMSENQAMLALGQVMKPHGEKMGERSVTYDNNGKPITLDFVNDKAVKITVEKQ